MVGKVSVLDDYRPSCWFDVISAFCPAPVGVWCIIIHTVIHRNQAEFPIHEPVLLEEVIRVFGSDRSGVLEHVIDGTVGMGGHSEALLEHCTHQLLGLDRDAAALPHATDRLQKYAPRFQLKHRSYLDMVAAAAELGWREVDGILLDLGFSSVQVATPVRGFSFQLDGPLDMRYDCESGDTAADWLNAARESEIAQVLLAYGEEPQSRAIARAIGAERPIHTTKQLSELVERVKGAGSRRAKIHPATRTFQAIRMFVNDELGILKKALPQAIRLLRTGGRLAVISFHSIEDRVVKRFFQEASRNCICPPEKLLCDCGHVATVKRVTRKPIRARSREIAHNPRSRSARLRVVEAL